MALANAVVPEEEGASVAAIVRLAALTGVPLPPSTALLTMGAAVAEAMGLLDRLKDHDVDKAALKRLLPAARARVRRAVVHAAEVSTEAVNLCYRAAGGSALFASGPFEAALRDVNAMCCHLVFQRAMMEDAGRVALGQAPTLAVF